MKKISILILFCFCISTTDAEPLNHSGDKWGESKALFQYDIFSADDDIGDINIHIIKLNPAGHVFHELSQINVSGIWGKIELISSLSEEYSGHGELIKADKKERDGKKAFWTQIQLLDEEIWASTTQIKKLSEIEEQQFVDLSVGLISSMIPNVGDVISISQLIFSDSDGKKDSFRIDKDSYDTTFSNMPFYWQKNQYQFPAELTILDTDTLSVYSVKTEFMGTEKNIKTQSIGGTKHHYRMTPPEGKHFDIWVAVDAQNTPHLVQLIAEDKDGEFKIKIKP